MPSSSSPPGIAVGGVMKFGEVRPSENSHGISDLAATTLPYSRTAMSQALAVVRTWNDFSVKFGCFVSPHASGLSAAAPCHNNAQDASGKALRGAHSERVLVQACNYRAAP